MKLILQDGQYVAQSTFAEKDIPKKANFRWEPTKKIWYTDDPFKAQQLAQFGDDEVRAAIATALAKKQVVIEQSKQITAERNIAVASGLAYLPYQIGGIDYAMERKNVLFGDEMGLGKTIQAIGLFNATLEMKRVLVVCPASLKLNWKREFNKWAARPISVEVVGISKIDPFTADVVIINYNLLKQYHNELRSVEWDYLIVDEAHYMKNGKALRAKEVLGFWSNKPEEVVAPIPARRKAFLTGTPIPNRPVESWSLLHALAPETFKSWTYFVRRYCAGERTKYGWEVKGASNLAELQMKMRESVMVRRLKSEVLKELPAKRRQVIEISAEGVATIIQAEQVSYNALQEKLEILKADVELAKVGFGDYEAAVRLLKDGMSALFEEMAKLRHETALAKVPFVIEHLKECFESDGGKIICFAHHHDVIEKITEAFKNECVVVTGQTPVTKRQAAVDSFQNDPAVKLFIGNILAAGVGLTLTASSHVIFAELDWVPGNITQAEDRAHRIGQTESVLVQHLVFEGSLDVEMANRLIEKQAVIDAALDGFELDVVLPEKIEVAPVVVAVKEFKVPEYTAEQVNAIQTGLRYLAMVCDGANAIDGMGFNKMDTHIGKKLASVQQLSHKQAVLGKKLVLKYRRQLNVDLIEILK